MSAAIFRPARSSTSVRARSSRWKALRPAGWWSTNRPRSALCTAGRRYLETIVAETGDVDITKEPVLVSIGRGIQEQDNVAIAEELAEAMGAAVSCSRPVVDAKWMEKSRQVGSSGQTVKPKVYLACGISGSFQHLAGIKGNPFIVAINKNPKAPIFRVADVGIVADILEFLPELTSQDSRKVRRLPMIAKKTLKLSLKSLREFAKKRLPDAGADRAGCARRMPARDRAAHVQPGQAGHSAPVHSRGVRRHGRRRLRRVLRLRRDGAHRSGRRHRRAGHVSGQRSDHRRRHAGAEEDLAERASRKKGLLFAYGATEPDAGSDLGALQTTADRVMEDGRIVGYKINGSKQWISNGGIADAYTVLANTPAGPSWFIVEKGAPGFSHDKPEDKHGIRLSNTAALSFNDVYVDADRLVGGVEGQGLIQAQAVFGYTRLMVAAFGLGAGWAALDRAIPYSTKRIQAGAPLSEKQGYTHKLIVPNVARLEAGRAFIEETAERIDAGEGSLNTEGAIAKYMSTEAGNLAADASIQALGGYGYTHEYMVEKISRDVRITTIYEGTSEIMEMTISRDRWQLAPEDARPALSRAGARSSKRSHARHPDVGANVAALALHALAEVMEKARVGRLTRYQHILLRLGELIAYAECAGSLARRAARMAEGKLNEKANQRFDAAALAAISRIFAREAALKVAKKACAG